MLSPLFVSLLTSFASYPTAALTLLAASVISLFGELWWIGVVWNSWDCLEEAEAKRRRDRVDSASQEEIGGVRNDTQDKPSSGGVIRETIRDMTEFAQMPVFLSER